MAIDLIMKREKGYFGVLLTINFVEWQVNGDWIAITHKNGIAILYI